MDEKKIEFFAQALSKAFASQPVDNSISREEQVELLKAIASDPTARATYAKSRAEILLPQIAVQSTARKIFMEETLAPGSQANYPIDFDYTEVASWLPKIGGVVTRITEGDEVFIPTFAVEAAVRYSMDIAENGRLDVAARQMEMLKNRILAKEETAAWRLIKATFSGVNANQTVYCSGSSENFHSFSKKALNKLSVQMDVQRRQLTDVFVSPVSLGDVREWSNTTIDYLTQREIFQNGGLPNNQVWDIRLNKVYDSTLVGDAAAWGFDVRSFGKMPIAKTLVTYEDPTAIQTWEVGVQARERIGLGVTDSYAVVKAILDSTHVGSACSSL